MPTALEFEALMAGAASRLSSEGAFTGNTSSAPALLTHTLVPPSFVERSAIWLARREEHVLDLRRQVEAVKREDERGLTFSPKISRVSKIEVQVCGRGGVCVCAPRACAQHYCA